MTAADTYDRLPDAVTDIFGADATATYAYDLLTVDVPAAAWTGALETARDALGCSYFDWLSAVDEGTAFRVCAHVAALGDGTTVRRLLVRTTVPHETPGLPSAVGVYAGAAWHERETYEMFGIGFEGHPHLAPLLLPEGFEGHPLRKDFVLAARVAKAWPGAKEPGESEHGGPKRRTMLPPGVPDPNEWGPLKGQLPPAPARPARAARAAGDRPVRRARSVTEGSAAQRPAAPDTATAPDAAATPEAAPARRTRSASQGSASRTTGSTPPSAPSAASDAAPSDAAPSDAGSAGTPPAGSRQPRAVRSTDAPWHHARPAFEGDPEPDPGTPGDTAAPGPDPGTTNQPRPGAAGSASPSKERAAEPGERQADAGSGAEAAPAPQPQDDSATDPDAAPRTDPPAGGDTA
ncbi:NADH-quinone oxidoreductase subunit C [Streptomyces sp. NPDC057429]|uniref:NADH-quinone oxidoreductase subunit C n=1 Tax=Streptomyces sp. NPDC057429 TaxID=3346130 RepID=UPI0036B46317